MLETVEMVVRSLDCRCVYVVRDDVEGKKAIIIQTFKKLEIIIIIL